MIDCKKLREVLDLYADRELSPDAIAQANAHISECYPCRRAFEGLSRLREAIRTTVGEAVPSEGLSQRMRGLVAPRWYRAAARPAMATALILVGTLTLPVPGVRGKVDAALNALYPGFGNRRQVVMEGTLQCRDQQLKKKYGYVAMCLLTGHHGWLVTGDGRTWSLLEGAASKDLIHNSALLGRKVKIKGRAFPKANSIEVKSYQLL